MISVMANNHNMVDIKIIYNFYELVKNKSVKTEILQMNFRHPEIIMCNMKKENYWITIK